MHNIKTCAMCSLIACTQAEVYVCHESFHELIAIFVTGSLYTGQFSVLSSCRLFVDILRRIFLSTSPLMCISYSFTRDY